MEHRQRLGSKHLAITFNNTTEPMLKVVSNLAEIVKMRRTSVPYTISKYVERPFLISSCHGRVKFDFRYHIIVRSFCPLEAYAMKRFWPKLASKSYDLEVKFDNLCP